MAPLSLKRTVYFVSDGTAITVETLGRSLLTQFQAIDFQYVVLSFVDTPEAAQAAVQRINETPDKQPPLVFSTLVDPATASVLQQAKAEVMDLFDAFIKPLEKALGTASSHSMGLSHSMQNKETYKCRIDAINYALNCDDGAGIHNYKESDIIIVGVSRCGKTPTSLYLALQFGLKAANYPFTADDMDHLALPDFLRNHQNKLFGLTINPQRLHSIRSERRPNSQYAQKNQCQQEVRRVEQLFNQENIPYLDTSHHSIEEICATILTMKGLKRQFF